MAKKVNAEDVYAPWERQIDEPALWFDRFDTYYRSMGPSRSLLAAYHGWQESRKVKKSQTPSGAWRDACNDWNWQERAEAWDAEQRRQRLIQEQEAIEEMNRRHIERSTLLQDFGAARLGRLQRQLKADEGQIDVIGPGEARLYIKDGMAMERQARGLPDHLVEIAGLSNDDLTKRYHELLAAAIGATSSSPSRNGTTRLAHSNSQ